MDASQMSDDQRSKIKEILQQDDQRAGEALARFLAKNADPLRVVLETGFRLEYDAQEDDLYIAFGEPREGIAFFVDEMIVRADADTMDLLSTEILGFSRLVNEGRLSHTWEKLLEVVKERPTLDVSPGEAATAFRAHSDVSAWSVYISGATFQNATPKVLVDSVPAG